MVIIIIVSLQLSVFILVIYYFCSKNILRTIERQKALVMYSTYFWMSNRSQTLFALKLLSKYCVCTRRQGAKGSRHTVCPQLASSAAHCSNWTWHRRSSVAASATTSNSSTLLTTSSPRTWRSSTQTWPALMPGYKP